GRRREETDDRGGAARRRDQRVDRRAGVQGGAAAGGGCPGGHLQRGPGRRGGLANVNRGVSPDLPQDFRGSRSAFSQSFSIIRSCGPEWRTRTRISSASRTQMSPLTCPVWNLMNDSVWAWPVFPRGDGI